MKNLKGVYSSDDGKHQILKNCRFVLNKKIDKICLLSYIKVPSHGNPRQPPGSTQTANRSVG